MKNFIKIGSLLVLSVCFLTGCGEKEQTLLCTRTASQAGVEFDFKYEVQYKGTTVQKVSTVEKIKSNAPQMLDEYKANIEKIYSPYKDIKHYKYNVSVKDDTLTSTTDIDYSKIDTKELIKVDSTNEKLIKDGKINIADLKTTYESLGTTCKTK